MGKKVEAVTDCILFFSKITVDSDCSLKIKRHLVIGRKTMASIDKHIKKQRHHFADNGPYNQSYVFSNSPVQMWELDHTEGWVPKNWCFWIIVSEKSLESPLACKEINPVNPKGNQPWIFIGRTDAKIEAPILCPPDVKSPLTGKSLILGKIEDKRTGEWQRIKWLDNTINSTGINLKLWEIVKNRTAWCTVVHGVVKGWTCFSDWITKNKKENSGSDKLGTFVKVLDFTGDISGKEPDYKYRRYRRWGLNPWVRKIP